MHEHWNVLIVSMAESGILRVLDVDTLMVKKDVNLPQGGDATCMQLLPSGDDMVLGYSLGFVSIIDLTTFTLKHTMSVQDSLGIWGLRLLPNSRGLALGCHDGH